MYEKTVNHPPHYTSGAVECIEGIESALSKIEYLGCVMKYTWRLDKKGDPVEDAMKAQWYLDRLIKAMPC